MPKHMRQKIYPSWSLPAKAASADCFFDFALALKCYINKITFDFSSWYEPGFPPRWFFRRSGGGHGSYALSSKVESLTKRQEEKMLSEEHNRIDFALISYFNYMAIVRAHQTDVNVAEQPGTVNSECIIHGSAFSNGEIFWHIMICEQTALRKPGHCS